MKLFIDGENFRHKIAHILENHGKIEDSHMYFQFDWAGFLKEAVGAEANQVNYYTTRMKQPDEQVPGALQKRINEITEANRRQVADLINQGIQVIKAGYLKVHTQSPCVHCGKKTEVLQEKGVDVRVATDLLLAALEGTPDLVLVSSDSDLIPALDAVREKGTQTTYLCYTGWLNRAVAASTHNTITYDDNLVLKYYRGK